MVLPSTDSPHSAGAPVSLARRPRKSAQERRGEITAAARDLALSEGLEAVTLRAVAARVGVASGLVAHYVESMDDLVADVFGEIAEAELAEVLAVLPAAGLAPAPSRLGALLRTVLDGQRSDVTLVWVQAWALGVRNTALAARVRVVMDAWRAALADEIARGMAEGTIPVRDPDPLAWHLLAMIDGLGAHSLVAWGAGSEGGASAERDLVAPALRAASGLLGVAIEA